MNGNNGHKEKNSLFVKGKVQSEALKRAGS